MPEGRYWGKEGHYGPFDVQDDGWPNAGQVMRSFREQAGMTAKTFGVLYGKEIKKDRKLICERWILEMELENKVPVDITRRRVIARLLHIPPALLGLASLEEVTTEEVDASREGQASKRELHDIALYERNMRIALQIHLTSNAKMLLSDIGLDRAKLELLAGTGKGSTLARIQELLVANDLLAAKIVRDQRSYAAAYTYANRAVLTAKRTGDEELIATALYTRGSISLQWGQFGVMSQGRFQFDRTKVEDAVRDVQAVLATEATQQVVLHPQLRGFALLQLSRAHSVLQRFGSALEQPGILKLADLAAEAVERESIDDLYTRLVVTGTLSGLHLGGYLLTRADILTAAGQHKKAEGELHQLKRLTERTYGKDETRSQAWHAIVLAKSLIGLKEYREAVTTIRDALIACHSIKSMQNIAIIAHLYHEIASSSYGKAGDVLELGEMLEEWYGQ